MATDWYDGHLMCAMAPCLSWDSSLKPMLKRSHMHQSQRLDLDRRSYKTQELLKILHCFVLVQSHTIQHCLCTILRKTCCHGDQIHLHREKRDAPHREELALFPVDLKFQSGKVLEDQVPVCTTACIHRGSGESARCLAIVKMRAMNTLTM